MLDRAQEVLELQKPGSWESTAGDYQHIHIIISNIPHTASTIEYRCKHSLGLDHLSDSVWLFSLMKATLAARDHSVTMNLMEAVLETLQYS